MMAKDQVHQALLACERGDVAPALARLRATPGHPCERLVLQAQLALAGPAIAVMPSWDDLASASARCLASAASDPLALFCMGKALRAFHRLQLATLDAAAQDRLAPAVALHARLRAHSEAGETALEHDLLTAWEAWREDRPLAAPMLESLQERARHCGSASLLVEAVTVHALTCLRAPEDVAAAHAGKALARRAALMAQSEGLVHAHYLAALVLARMRRCDGKPHLATRILSALGKVAPAPYRAWLAWELGLAGGTGDTVGPAPALRDLAQHALAGDRAGFVTTGQRLAERLRAVKPLQRELVALLAVLLPDATDEVGALPPADRAACEDFRGGRREDAPYGLTAWVNGSTDTAEDEAAAVVVVTPEGLRVRCLRLGAALASLPRPAVVLSRMQRKQGRLDTAAAVLALAPDGLPAAPLFAAIYGFAYVPELHKGTFEVLMHRLKERLASWADIVRDTGQDGAPRWRLRVRVPLVIPDPRTASAVDARVLKWLAEKGETTAREAATRLGVPLRTVQAALAQMVNEGVVAVGEGAIYALEDTVFAEPTRS